MIIRKQCLPNITYSVIPDPDDPDIRSDNYYLALYLEREDFIRFKLLPPPLPEGDESSFLDILVVTGFTEANIRYVFGHISSDYSVVSHVGADYIYVTHPRCSAGVFLTFPSFPTPKDLP